MYIPGSFAWKHISENKNIQSVAVVILVKRVSDQVDSACADVRRRISVWRSLGPRSASYCEYRISSFIKAIKHIYGLDIFNIFSCSSNIRTINR